MVISRVSDQRPHLTSRSSESDLVTSSSRSRTESLLARVDFDSGVKSLTPFRQFYTSLRFEAGKLRGLDQRLVKEFEDDRFRTIEEEDETDGPSPMEEISSSPIRDESSLPRSSPPASLMYSDPSSTSLNQKSTSSSPPSSRPSSSDQRRSAPHSPARQSKTAFFFDMKKRINTTEDRFSRAAVYIFDAIHERPIKTHRSVGLPMRAYLLLQNYWYRMAMSCVGLVHLSLAFFEPALNFRDDTLRTYESSFSTHPAEFVNKILYVEFVIIGIYALDVGINLFCAGPRDYFGFQKLGRRSIRLKAITEHLPEYTSFRYLHHFKMVALIAFIVDAAMAWDGGVQARRFSRLLRPMYFSVWSPELRRWGMLISRTMPHIWELLVLLVVVLTIWSCGGVMLFGRSDTVNYYASDQLQNFKNFPLAFISMYVLFTTENYPDIMDPAYEQNKIYSVFFCSFLMLVMFFLGNLAIPTLYRAFKTNHHREALHGRILERTALLAAFQLLDIERKGYIEVDRFKDVLSRIRPDMFYKHGEEKEKGMAKTMFIELSRTDPERRKLYPIDFFRCCEVILVDWRVSRLDSGKNLYDRVCGSELKHFRLKLQIVLESMIFDKITLGLCTLVTFSTAFYNSGVVSNELISCVGKTYVYMCLAELLLKLYAIGFKELWIKWPTKYDIIVITVSCLAQVGGIFADEFADVVGHNELSKFLQTYRSSMGSLFIISRFARVIFVSNHLRKLRVVLTIYPFMANSMILTLLFLYFWALGGMYLFGEIDLSSDLVTQCSAEYESSVDFSNFAAANMRLFQILTSSNWHLIMYAAMCTVNHRRHAIYFILFHLVAVLILLQIVIAIYVEAFIAFQEKEEMSRGADSSEQLFFAEADDSNGDRTPSTSARLSEDEIKVVAEMRRQKFILSSLDNRGKGGGDDPSDKTRHLSPERPSSSNSSTLNQRSSPTSGGSSPSSHSAIPPPRAALTAPAPPKRVRVGSMPGFVSPLNAVARMDMPSFEQGEIDVLQSVVPDLQIREAAEKQNKGDRAGGGGKGVMR